MRVQLLLLSMILACVFAPTKQAEAAETHLIISKNWGLIYPKKKRSTGKVKSPRPFPTLYIDLGATRLLWKIPNRGRCVANVLEQRLEAFHKKGKRPIIAFEFEVLVGTSVLRDLRTLEKSEGWKWAEKKAREQGFSGKLSPDTRAALLLNWSKSKERGLLELRSTMGRRSLVKEGARPK